MKPKILTTDPEALMFQHVWEELTAIADVVPIEKGDEDAAIREIADADLIVVCYAKVTAGIMEAAPKLRGILKWGVSVDSIDVEAATQRGIPVAHCPHYGTNTVAEHTFALMICLARRMGLLNAAMKDRGWMWPDPACAGIDLSGKTLGILGLGRIGRALARRAEAFDMRILANDPYVEPDPGPWKDLRFVGLDELMASSDFLSINAVLTAETRGLVGEEELRRMRPSAFLINTARAAIVDEAALVKALSERWIAGAGIDVFWQEPPPPDHPLLTMDHVVLTPHFAYYTTEAEKRLDTEALEAVRDLLAGRAPKSLKNPSVFEKHPEE